MFGRLDAGKDCTNRTFASCHPYPALIMANGARMEGIEASIFSTFFGLYAVLKKFQDEIKIATVGNPAMRVPDAKGMLPTWMGAIPGMSSFATKMMKKEMDQLDIPPVGEFIEMIHDAGGHLLCLQGHGGYVPPDRGRLLSRGGKGAEIVFYIGEREK